MPQQKWGRTTSGGRTMRKKSVAEWVQKEGVGGDFGDRRLGKRCEKVFAALSERIGSSLSVACQNWANTKAADRFLANERVSEREMLPGHFQSTRERVAATEGPLLVLQDTTEFSCNRQEQAAIGLLRQLPMQSACSAQVLACGILMHSSLS
jgi:hypothetical protein